MRRVRFRWWELLPEAVAALGLGVFLVTEPDAATSAFESSRAITLMVGTAVLWLGLRLGLGRLGSGWGVARTGLFGAGAIAILAVVVLPAYDDETVVETLTVQTAPAPDRGPTPTGPVASTTTAAAQPRIVAAAELHGIDHRASGTARVYEQPSGALVVGLEEIDIQPGPDYDVYLVPGADREDVDGGVRLDDLRGNKGTQYYAVPDGVAVTAGAWTVLVWCQTFDVPVAGATPVGPAGIEPATEGL
jgi:hypothetical protein